MIYGDAVRSFPHTGTSGARIVHVLHPRNSHHHQLIRKHVELREHASWVALRGTEGLVPVLGLTEDYVELEFFPETLASLLSKSTHSRIEIAENCFRFLLFTLAAFHAKGWVHLDIKPDNIFVESSRYVIGDLGHACPSDTENPNPGHKSYLAPELRLASASGAKLADLCPCDVFSMGMVLLEILAPKLAHSYQEGAACSIEVADPRVLRREVLRELSERPVRPQLIDFLVACLRKNPDERPTVAQMRLDPWPDSENLDELCHDLEHAKFALEQHLGHKLSSFDYVLYSSKDHSRTASVPYEKILEIAKFFGGEFRVVLLRCLSNSPIRGWAGYCGIMFVVVSPGRNFQVHLLDLVRDTVHERGHMKLRVRCRDWRLNSTDDASNEPGEVEEEKVFGFLPTTSTTYNVDVALNTIHAAMNGESVRWTDHYEEREPAKTWISGLCCDYLSPSTIRSIDEDDGDMPPTTPPSPRRAKRRVGFL